VNGGEIPDRPIAELLRQHLACVAMGRMDILPVESGGGGLVELEEMERRAVDAGQEARGLPVSSRQARQPVRTAKR
jgi:hypothetical protein